MLASSLDAEFSIYPYTHICTGNEKSLCECNSVEPGTDSESCPSGMVVAIQCTAPGMLPIVYYYLTFNNSTLYKL